MCRLHMWIIYRLWGFLLLKPALGVLQIPAQSPATQSRSLAAKYTSTPLYRRDNKRWSADFPVCPLTRNGSETQKRNIRQTEDALQGESDN